MAKIVTKEIREAIRKSIDELGSAVEFERRSGVTNSNFSKYLSGQSRKMNESTWAALFPLLKKFLPESYQHNERSNVFNGGTHYGAAIANVRDVSTGTDSVERFRAAAIAAIIDLDIDPAAQSAVLKILKNLKI